VRDLRGSAEWQGRSAKLAFIILGTMRGISVEGLANVRNSQRINTRFVASTLMVQCERRRRDAWQTRSAKLAFMV
jgi:hypothetical protein